MILMETLHQQGVFDSSSVLERAVNAIAPICRQYGFGISFGIEKGPVPMQELTGKWHEAYGDSENVQIMISRRATTDLSSLAFEGLLYHATAKYLLGRPENVQHGTNLQSEEGINQSHSSKESLADIVHQTFLNGTGLVRYRAELANMEYRELPVAILAIKYLRDTRPDIRRAIAHIDLSEESYIAGFQEYLVELAKHLPQVALEIWRELDFKDKVRKPLVH